MTMINAMSTLTIIIAFIVALWIFWALRPRIEASPAGCRILRSPATWALVALIASFVWLHWAEARVRREMAALNAAQDMQQKMLDQQIETCRQAWGKEVEWFTSYVTRKLAEAEAAHDADAVQRIYWEASRYKLQAEARFYILKQMRDDAAEKINHNEAPASH
jgi:hypothetical protein